MPYGSITPEILAQFEAIVGQGNLFVDEETRTICASDETEDHVFMPSTWCSLQALPKKLAPFCASATHMLFL
jgi:hypothetical protein